MSSHDEIRQDTIERYVRKEMTSEEVISFEKEMGEDEELRGDVEATRAIMEGLVSVGIREQIAQIHQEAVSDQSNGHTGSTIKWAWISGVAAALVLLLAATVIFYNSQKSNEELFVAYFKVYPDVVSIRGKGTGSLSGGLKEYTSGNYQKAIDIFEAGGFQQTEMEHVLFYQGLSYLALKQAERSVLAMEELEQRGSRYDQQLQWYLSLGYLLSEEQEKGVEKLKGIGKGEFQYQEAQKLLEALY